MPRLRIPLATHWTETPVGRAVRPMQEFVHSSTAGGIVLLFAAVVALVLANSPLRAPYEEVLNTYLDFQIGTFQLHQTVLHWINDGLMAIFFFLVGLEIKREIWAGELSNVRAALLPIVAALGVAIVPALVYAAINLGGPGNAGWGIPMATDIAFALGVLALVGSHLPFTLKILLTAIAIIDDLIAVLVIAFFYSGSLDFSALGIGFALLGVLLAMNAIGIRNIPLYALIGVLVWVAFLQSGVHATIAGVLVALMIPVRTRINQVTFLQRARSILDSFEDSSKREPYSILQDQEQQSAVIELEELSEAVQAPLQKMEHTLHNWVAFIIMPLFALANAGVALSAEALRGETLPVALGILAGLLIGKPLGLFGATWLAVRAGLVTLPQSVTWRHIAGLACLGGIGFTMSLFVATLAFGGDPLLETAKLGILAASLIAGTAGFLLLKTTPAGPDPTP
ncbi:MAG TPA: Na+/H+ antiporter NhaA [Chloroflexia bacterium]|nr:Na+/H+ antiporter NhaA [Chloroflexia bacterium]